MACHGIGHSIGVVDGARRQTQQVDQPDRQVREPAVEVDPPPVGRRVGGDRGVVLARQIDAVGLLDGEAEQRRRGVGHVGADGLRRPAVAVVQRRGVHPHQGQRRGAPSPMRC
ncbi:MAG: hypothetical protein R2699_12040 [Acidimicrobiales bacterium]